MTKAAAKPSAKKPKKRTASRSPYRHALNAAQKRLARALMERAECQQKLSLLAGEIPDLERTITALGGMVTPTVPAQQTFVNQPIHTRGPEQTDFTLMLQNAESKPLIPYVEPDLSTAGSIPAGASITTEINPEPELPNLGGDWQ